MNIDDDLREALRLHESGQLQKAETIYRNILETHPDHADALHFLGVVFHQSGRFDKAGDNIVKKFSPKSFQ